MPNFENDNVTGSYFEQFLKILIVVIMLLKVRYVEQTSEYVIEKIEPVR